MGVSKTNQTSRKNNKWTGTSMIRLLLITTGISISVFGSTSVHPSNSPTQAPRTIFKDNSIEENKFCSVVKPDISSNLILETVENWRFGTADQGYPKGNVAVCVIHWDDASQSMSMLMTKQSSMNQMKLMPVTDRVKVKGQSLKDKAFEMVKGFVPNLDSEEVSLLNAVYTAHPEDKQDTPVRVLYSSFVVFVHDKHDVNIVNKQQQWYTIKEDHTLYSYDSSSSSGNNGWTMIDPTEYWFMTHEILLSLRFSVHCPGQSITNSLTPSMSTKIPDFSEPNQKDLDTQQQFFRDRGCMVDGSDIVYKKGINKEEECHHALLYEMRRICGDQFSVGDATEVRCLIHGATADYDWSLPRRSTLTIEPDLWTAGVLVSFETNFKFGWVFDYTFRASPTYGGMVAILAVDKPEDCFYQKQSGEKWIKEGSDRSKGVIRYQYKQKSYRNIDTSRVPDAWIYTSWAANNCGLRLLKQYYFRPSSTMKRNLVIPTGCSVTPLLFDGLSEERIKKWVYKVADQGISKAIVYVYPLVWDDPSKSLYFASMIQTQTIKFDTESDKFLPGFSFRYAAARIMQNEGFGDIRAKDMQLMGAYKYGEDIRAMYGVFLGHQETLGNPNRLEWLSKDQFKLKNAQKIKYKDKVHAVIDTVHCQ